jgi:predicted flap endonuclease-1-like 5' DNA nuclease
VKRLARVLGVVGGLGAIAWAMRDRLVSVAISREPVPPAFKVPESSPTPMAPLSDGDDRLDARELTAVGGIGPVYATRLESVGISTLADLAASRPEQVAAAAEVPLARANGWIDAAGDLTKAE